VERARAQAKPCAKSIEIADGGAASDALKRTPPRFAWKLEPGKNVLLRFVTPASLDGEPD